MSYFRNLNKVVSSQLFTKPNNFVLTSCHRPVYLQTSPQATIEYLHSSKALFNTFNHLQKLQERGSFGKLVNSEVDFLEAHRQIYAEKIREFIHKGGLLTGEGIANTYYCASWLNLSAEWLESNIHHEIPRKIKFMSRSNLKDTLDGLKKIHSDSPYLKDIEQELSSRSESEPEYVSYLPNETVRYEHADKGDSSNPLLNSTLGGQPVWRYYAQVLIWKFLHGGKYVLHSE